MAKAFSRRPRVESLEDRRLLVAYLVNTLDDVVAVDSLVSLREAILSANQNAAVNSDVVAGAADGDTISFDATLAGQTINLPSGELSITDDVVLDGSAGIAGTRITIDAGGESRIFFVSTSGAAGANADVTLSNLVVTNGNTINAATNVGGAINVAGSSLALDNVDITQSTAAVGGGLSSDTNSNVTVTNSSIVGNTATELAGGGGIYNRGAMSLQRSSVSGNTALFLGGGLTNYQGTLAVIDSTVSGNAASQHGGGFYNAPMGTLTVTNSTVSGNSASSNGDGRTSAVDALMIINHLRRQVVAEGSGLSLDVLSPHDDDDRDEILLAIDAALTHGLN